MTTASYPVETALEKPLPTYAHPPIVLSRLTAAWSTPLEFDTALQRALMTELSPTWRLPTGSTGTSWQLSNVLRDQQGQLTPTELDFRWNGDGGAYPHYESVRDGFVVLWDALGRCCEQLDRSPPAPTAWTVRYRNRIPQGTVWNDLAAANFFRLLPSSRAVLPEFALDQLHANWEFRLTDPAVALTVTLSTEGRSTPAALLLELTCRGSITPGEATLFEGFDTGRRVIVRTFGQLMTPQAGEYWGRVK